MFTGVRPRRFGTVVYSRNIHNPIVKSALVGAGAAALYIVCVALFLSYTKQLFGPEEPKTFLVPVFMLLLFVVSAAVTGFAVVGRPLMWYLDGRKRDALALLTLCAMLAGGPPLLFRPCVKAKVGKKTARQQTPSSA